MPPPPLYPGKDYILLRVGTSNFQRGGRGFVCVTMDKCTLCTRIHDSAWSTVQKHYKADLSYMSLQFSLHPPPAPPPPPPPTPSKPDLLIGVLEGEAELLHVAENERLVLVQHPVPLLLVFLCLQVRTMKLSNAIICSYIIQFFSSSFAWRWEPWNWALPSYAREASSSPAARLPLPAGEKHETEQCSCSIQFCCCSSSFAWRWEAWNWAMPSYARPASCSARLPLPAGENHETEQCLCSIQLRGCSSSFAWRWEA